MECPASPLNLWLSCARFLLLRSLYPLGAWTENEIDILLDAWEEAVKTPRTPGKVFDIAEKVLNVLSRKDFRNVERDEVWKQMSTLRTEYR